MSEFSHLDELEAEAIYIIREVAAECEKPVMLYSIGKDSSVMLHLALKAFYPEKPPFPFLHVNTTWKFREMIEFRDRTAQKLGIEMLEYINQDGVKQGINPFDHGSAYTDIMKTQALKQALNKYGFTAAFGGGRRDEEKSRAKERIFSFRNSAHAGPKRTSGSTSSAKRLILFRCTLRPRARSWCAMATSSWWTTTASRCEKAKRPKSSRCVFARWAATRSREASNRLPRHLTKSSTKR